MKLCIQIFIAVLILSIKPTLAQNYSSADSLALLAIDDSCDVYNILNWDTESDPGNWVQVKWSDDTPKRVDTLDIFSLGLTGNLYISALDSLKVLACMFNELNSIHISSPINLKLLQCSFNQLTNLEVSSILNLTGLYCYNNQIDTLDLSSLENLEELSCADNQIVSLELPSSTALKSIQCNNNQLTILDVSSLNNLEELSCYNNQLTNLNVSALTNLKTLDCNTNQLSDLDVSSLTNLIELDCSGNHLSNLDVLALDTLTILNCGNNQLTDIDISLLTNLTKLQCGSNQISNLELSSQNNLTHLEYYDNQIQNIDLSNLDSLEFLDCSDNNITHLDISSLTKLETLFCFDNHLSTLNLSGLSDLKNLLCFNNNLTYLDISTNTSLDGINCSNNKLSGINLSSHPYLGQLFIDNNQLPFSALAQGLDIVVFNYDPQDTIYQQAIPTGIDTIDYSEESIINDSVTTFTFYKDGEITETNTTGLYPLSDSGTYFCQMTNGLFPGLTLTTYPITYENSSLLVSDKHLDIAATENSKVTFKIISNTTWEIESSEDWLSVDPTSGSMNDTITLIAEENPGNTTRTATITVTGTSVEAEEITVTQAANDINNFKRINQDVLTQIYPVPSNGFLNIKLKPDLTNVYLEIFTTKGMRVYSRNINTKAEELDLSDLPSGVYILRIKADNYSENIKIVISK